LELFLFVNSREVVRGVWPGDGGASYQEDFVIPGIWPLWASSRRQIRQIPNLR
jgi:hypothetical protein